MLPPVKPTPVTTQVSTPQPMLDMKAGERAVMKAPPGSMVQVDTEVLKYGHPGTSPFLPLRMALDPIATIGPVSDLLVRRAYITAYDRQKRHPAWVCLVPCVFKTCKFTNVRLSDSGASHARIFGQVTSPAPLGGRRRQVKLAVQGRCVYSRHVPCEAAGLLP